MQDHEAQNRQQQLATSLAEIFLQQSARLIDIQAAAARSLMRTQARSAAAFGVPDWSALYSVENEHQFSELLRTSTEQAVSFMRQTNDTLYQWQQAANQLLVRQTNEVTTQIRTNAEEIGNRVEQSAAEARRTAQQAAGIVQQAASGMEGGRVKRPA